MPRDEKKISLSVVVPAFNEEEGIEEVVKDLKETLQAEGFELGKDSEILVVDDGSKDRTAELAEKAGARVERHPCNLGYGKALLTGFDKSRYDWVLTIDGDGSYPTKEIAKLLPYAPDFDMVVGARQGSFFWGSPMKAVLRLVYLRLSSFVAGIDIPDANSGIRLVRKIAEQTHMPVPCYGFSFSTTITLSFVQQALPVKFVPVEYLARKGRSKVHIIRDMLRTLQLMLEIIIYFNPIKFCVVLSSIPLALGAVFAGRLIAFGCSYGDFALLGLCLLGALITFLCGCVLDSIRLHCRTGSPS